MTPKEQLLEAAEFFEKNPDKWTQNRFAEDKAGNKIGCLTPKAYRFCVWGYFYSKYRTRTLVTFVKPLIISEADTITSWNDKPGRTVEEVVALLNKAAELCE